MPTPEEITTVQGNDIFFGVSLHYVFLTRDRALTLFESQGKDKRDMGFEISVRRKKKCSIVKNEKFPPWPITVTFMNSEILKLVTTYCGILKENTVATFKKDVTISGLGPSGSK